MNYKLPITLILVFAVGYALGVQLNETKIITYNETRPINIVTYEPIPTGDNYTTVLVPAVDENKKGVTTILTVQIVPGSGKLLANIDRLLFWTDTQNSIRMSKNVAETMTGKSLSDYDIIYTIDTNATTVEGVSAGAALTVATIAVLQGREINRSVMITGSVNHDGTIGPVGEIIAKARASKESGAKLFLVPLSQSNQVRYRDERFCEQIGVAEICTNEKIPDKIDVSEETGIEVKEVGTIEEALEYFLI